MEADSVYKFHDDVYLAVDEKNESCKLVKLDDDNFYFSANLVAAEIIRQIDGKKTFSQILEVVSEQYDEAHRAEIEAGARDLISKLLNENLITKL